MEVAARGVAGCAAVTNQLVYPTRHCRRVITCYDAPPRHSSINPIGSTAMAPRQASHLLVSERGKIVIDDTPEVLDLLEILALRRGVPGHPRQEASVAVDTVRPPRRAAGHCRSGMAGVDRWELVDAS